MAGRSPQPRATDGILSGEMRQTVNEWIRKDSAFDEVMDFNRLTP